MAPPKDLQEFLHRLQASPKWKGMEENGSGQSLADVIIAAYENRKNDEWAAGKLEISFGRERRCYYTKDMDKVGAYIAQHGYLPEEWSTEGAFS